MLKVIKKKALIFTFPQFNSLKNKHPISIFEIKLYLCALN